MHLIDLRVLRLKDVRDFFDFAGDGAGLALWSCFPEYFHDFALVRFGVFKLGS